MSPMQKVMLAVEGSNELTLGDVILWAGEPWLVPLWLDDPIGKDTVPERIVQLTKRISQATPGGEADYVINSPVPTSVLSGPGPFPPGYIVMIRPPISLPIGDRIN